MKQPRGRSLSCLIQLLFYFIFMNYEVMKYIWHFWVGTLLCVLVLLLQSRLVLRLKEQEHCPRHWNQGQTTVCLPSLAYRLLHHLLSHSFFSLYSSLSLLSLSFNCLSAISYWYIMLNGLWRFLFACLIVMLMVICVCLFCLSCFMCCRQTIQKWTDKVFSQIFSSFQWKYCSKVSIWPGFTD